MPLPTLKLYECYARLEDCIEKWEEVSEIGLRALSMVCQSVSKPMLLLLLLYRNMMEYVSTFNEVAVTLSDF